MTIKETNTGFNGILYLRPNEVRPALKIYTNKLIEYGHEPERIKELVAIFYTNKIIVKYTDEQEDNMQKYWHDMINSGPEGFKQAMDYALSNTATYEHRLSRCSQSYEKGNVSDRTRRAEKPWEFPKKKRNSKKTNKTNKSKKGLKTCEVIN